MSQRDLCIRNPGRIGRGSAGPRPAKRTLDREEVLARQARWRGEPASPERTRELQRCRVQLINIANRSERGG